jgi:hypothetical protein
MPVAKAGRRLGRLTAVQHPSRLPPHFSKNCQHGSMPASSGLPCCMATCMATRKAQGAGNNLGSKPQKLAWHRPAVAARA